MIENANDTPESNMVFRNSLINLFNVQCAGKCSKDIFKMKLGEKGRQNLILQSCVGSAKSCRVVWVIWLNSIPFERQVEERRKPWLQLANLSILKSSTLPKLNLLRNWFLKLSKILKTFA